MQNHRAVGTGFDQQSRAVEVDVFDKDMAVVSCSFAEFAGTQADDRTAIFFQVFTLFGAG